LAPWHRAWLDAVDAVMAVFKRQAQGLDEPNDWRRCASVVGE
jgi:hypothetical protein